MDEIEEKLRLKIVFSFFPKHVLPNPYKILGLYFLIYIYIYIKHKEKIGLWSNGLTKAREKIEQWTHS